MAALFYSFNTLQYSFDNEFCEDSCHKRFHTVGLMSTEADIIRAYQDDLAKGLTACDNLVDYVCGCVACITGHLTAVESVREFIYHGHYRADEILSFQTLSDLVSEQLALYRNVLKHSAIWKEV